ncbi:hypothetical protein TNCT_307941 [Trichonephila clavata]|uniref:Uncharacterized protein n=1 Tax=Trichonephila clavata TaxID=2740835 RepID=A0A8X6LPN2_TRICU|nr:hypothetical protein TNCT_307941 [Trichonephila clavata]
MINAWGRGQPRWRENGALLLDDDFVWGTGEGPRGNGALISAWGRGQPRWRGNGALLLDDDFVWGEGEGPRENGAFLLATYWGPATTTSVARFA